MTAPAWAVSRLTVDVPAVVFVRTVQHLARFAAQQLDRDLAQDGLRVEGRVALTVGVARWLDGSGAIDVTVTVTAADVRPSMVPPVMRETGRWQQ